MDNPVDPADPVRRPLVDEWCVLAGLLPENWEALAWETDAMQRARGQIRTAETLLRVLLMHVATGLSLKQTVARARVQGLVEMSAPALHFRLRSSEAWLRELARRMFESGARMRGAAVAPAGRRLRAVDATTVEEPGATGTDWRVHYVIALPELRCDFYELTDAKGTETFKRLPVEPGDIMLADRGYCHREGVAHVRRHGGDVLVRLTSRTFPLLRAEADEPFALLPHLRELGPCEVRGWDVRFRASGRAWDARVCAVRCSEAAAARATKRISRKAQRQQREIHPDTVEFAKYVVVLTTVGAEELSATRVLELYRARWQVELCFKRFKSLLHLGALPKSTDASARAWIQAKLLTTLLIEALVDRAAFFSPWGFALEPTECVA